MRQPMRTLAARYVFPVEGTPILDGSLSIADGRIVRVGPALEGPPVDDDLGNVAITPGFVNAHTHLELEPIAPSVGSGPEDEVGWLRRVVEARRTSRPGSGAEAARRNVQASVAAGTTLLADVTTAGQSWEAVAEAPLRGVVFAELIGLNRKRGMETSAQAFDWLAKVRTEDPEAKTRPGLSPHAPYSTAGWLYHRAATSQLPLMTHLAEMPEELELLRERAGPLRAFLEDLGAWDEDWEPIGDRPAAYIRKGELRQADWIVAHANYFDPDEFWQLRPEAAPDGQRVAVVYCPRTHARFGHSPHPYRAMLERGIIVALGTDSLASSPTLSVLDEMRFLHRLDESASGQLLLTMATLFGAWALRSEDFTGSMKLGKSADLAVVELPDRHEADPYALLLDSDLPVVATLYQGEFVHGAWS
ncbi:amidohydrolase family protein [Tundrisphaera lichenicola]|uniref:amidohydrolase family protein n=1 Tax=Tundrisphaera lichenicola TaxID=2029860 RepID=UPI003EB9706E